MRAAGLVRPSSGRPKHAYNKLLKAEGLHPDAVTLYYELKTTIPTATTRECVALANRWPTADQARQQEK